MEKTYDCPIFSEVTNENEKYLVSEATAEIAILVERAYLLLCDTLEADFNYNDEYIRNEGMMFFLNNYNKIDAKLRAADAILYHVCTLFDFLNGTSTNRTEYYMKCSNGLADFLK